MDPVEPAGKGSQPAPPDLPWLHSHQFTPGPQLSISTFPSQGHRNASLYAAQTVSLLQRLRNEMRAARVAACLLLPAAACGLGGAPWQHVQGELLRAHARKTMRAARVAVCLLLPAAACALGGDPWQHVQGELHPADFSARQCVAGARPAFEPRPLEFCSWHVGRSCCTPMHDERSHEHFSKMTALGHPCSHSEHSVKHRYLRLRYWSCLQCDPGEPTYRYNVYDGYAPNNILPQ
eukprot:gene37-68_t